MFSANKQAELRWRWSSSTAVEAAAAPTLSHLCTVQSLVWIASNTWAPLLLQSSSIASTLLPVPPWVLVANNVGLAMWPVAPHSPIITFKIQLVLPPSHPSHEIPPSLIKDSLEMWYDIQCFSTAFPILMWMFKICCFKSRAFNLKYDANHSPFIPRLSMVTKGVLWFRVLCSVQGQIVFQYVGLWILFVK